MFKPAAVNNEPTTIQNAGFCAICFNLSFGFMVDLRVMPGIKKGPRRGSREPWGSLGSGQEVTSADSTLRESDFKWRGHSTGGAAWLSRLAPETKKPSFSGLGLFRTGRQLNSGA